MEKIWFLDPHFMCPLHSAWIILVLRPVAWMWLLGSWLQYNSAAHLQQLIFAVQFAFSYVGVFCVCVSNAHHQRCLHIQSFQLKEGTQTASARGLRFNSFTLEEKWGQLFSISHQSSWITSVTWILWQVSSALIRQISVSYDSLGFLKWSKMLRKMLEVLEH